MVTQNCISLSHHAVSASFLSLSMQPLCLALKVKANPRSRRLRIQVQGVEKIHFLVGDRCKASREMTTDF